MKCPKCGYNSYDHLDSCKKCGGDLTSIRQRLGLFGLSSASNPSHQPSSVSAVKTPASDSPPSPADLANETSLGELLGGADRTGEPPATGLEESPFSFSAHSGSEAQEADFDLTGGFQSDKESPSDYQDEFILGSPALEESSQEAFSFDAGPENPSSVLERSEEVDSDPSESLAFLQDDVESESEEFDSPVIFSDPGKDELPSLFRRIGSTAVDSAVIGMAFLLFVMAGEMALSSTEQRQYFPSPDALADLAIPYFLVLFGISFGYFTIFHFLTGQTPGKMFLGLRVEGLDGFPLSFSQSFLHSCGGLISLLAGGAGYLMIPFDRDRRGWNDRLAGTRIVSGGFNPENTEDVFYVDDPGDRLERT